MMSPDNTVLIVDDQDNWREALLSVLVKDGFSVSEADSLRTARDALDEQEYSVIIMDVRLMDDSPGDISGLELLLEMRSHWTESNRPGLIVITGYSSGALEVAAYRKLKVDAFFPKNPPEGFDLDGFLVRVRQLITG
jgi:DNA-binding NtrC family response regulator